MEGQCEEVESLSKMQSGNKRLNVQVDNEKIWKSSEFCYLGSHNTKNGRCNTDMGHSFANRIPVLSSEFRFA